MLGVRNNAHVVRVDAIRLTVSAVMEIVRAEALVVAARVGPTDSALVDNSRPAPFLIESAAVATWMLLIHATKSAPRGVAVPAKGSWFAVPVGSCRVALRTERKDRRERRHTVIVHARKLAPAKAIQRRRTQLVENRQRAASPCALGVGRLAAPHPPVKRRRTSKPAAAIKVGRADSVVVTAALVVRRILGPAALVEARSARTVRAVRAWRPSQSLQRLRTTNARRRTGAVVAARALEADSAGTKRVVR